MQDQDQMTVHGKFTSWGTPAMAHQPDLAQHATITKLRMPACPLTNCSNYTQRLSASFLGGIMEQVQQHILETSGGLTIKLFEMVVAGQIYTKSLETH